MVDTGVIHGRFQILHLKQMEFLLAAKMRCRKLFIGITNPDALYVTESVNDEQRSLPASNPFTYFERFEMIHDALLDFNVRREEFEIVPFPISRPEYILNYAPGDATYFMSICGAWDEEKLKILKGLNLKTEIIWRRNEEERSITGHEIRELIRAREDWESLVPKTVYEYVKQHQLEKKVRDLA